MDRDNRTGRARACVALAASALLVLAASANADTEPPSFAELAASFSVAGDDVQKMLDGNLVIRELEAASDNELALAAGMLSRRDVEWHRARLARRESSDPTILATGPIEGDGAASLQKLVVKNAVLDSLAEAEPGSEWNFSTAEYARLAAIDRSGDEGATRAGIAKALREILRARYLAYREKGLAGVAPYDRNDGESTNAAEQLARAFGEIQVTQRLAPTVHAAMRSFPAPVPEGMSSNFTWSIHSSQGQTLIALGHRIFGVENGHLVAIERRYFVHQSLNSMQAVAVAAPVREGTAVLYSNRAATDLITGWGASVVKKIGRSLMRGEVKRLAEEFLGDSDGAG